MKFRSFHGESKRKIFQTLRQQLPMMRNYSEANFYAYFWQSIWAHLNFSKRFATLYLNPIWINARKAVTISVAAFFVLPLHRISKAGPENPENPDRLAIPETDIRNRTNKRKKQITKPRDGIPDN